MKTEAYIKKIIEETGLSKNEIQTLVEEKKEELKGLISEEGALFVIAKELGVDVASENQELLNEVELNISDITVNMKNIVIVGRIKEIHRVNSFNKSNGETGYVGSFLLHDNTGDIRITLWDNHVSIFKDERFELNEIVKILNGTAKPGRNGDVEIHVGGYSKISLAPEDVDYKKFPQIKEQRVTIKDINEDLGSISTEGKVMNRFPVKEFTRKDGQNGSLSSIILRDSTDKVRITFWNDDIEKIENVEVGDYISLTNLNSRKSNYAEGRIDVHATSRTKITKKDKKLKIEVKNIDKIDKLQDIDENLESISIEGKVMTRYPVKDFIRKDGQNGSVSSILLRDSTGQVRVTFWNDDIKKIKNVEVGDYISLTNLNSRKSNYAEGRIDVHATSWTEITKEDKELKIDEKIIDKIEDLQKEKDYASFQGVITTIEDLRKITLKSGDEVSLLSFTVSDDTDSIRVTAWKEKADDLSKTLKNGEGISLKNIVLRYSTFSEKTEGTISFDSTLEKIDLKISNLKLAETTPKSRQGSFSNNITEINSIQSSGFFEIKGLISSELKNIRFYEACTNCRRKVDNCTCDQKGDSKLTMIISHFIEDESGKIRATFIGEAAEKLVGRKADLIAEVKDTPDYEKLLENFSSDLVGRDITIKGRVKFSDYSDSYEITASDFRDIIIEDELESRMNEIIS